MTSDLLRLCTGPALEFCIILCPMVYNLRHIDSESLELSVPNQIHGSSMARRSFQDEFIAAIYLSRQLPLFGVVSWCSGKCKVELLYPVESCNSSIMARR
jgi:hypothetical protein